MKELILLSPRVNTINSWIAISLALAAISFAKADPLPQTQPLIWEEEDLSGRLMDGAYAFIDRKTEEAISKRGFNWAPELESIESF
ncbi:MAG: hypothetical protein AAF226_12845, partial [Verrucomicrobiota bacterium]